MNYKFFISIRKSADKQYYAVLVSKLNREDILVGETRKSSSGIVRTMKNIFPGVTIKKDYATAKGSN